jgi:hypothetical protein
MTVDTDLRPRLDAASAPSRRGASATAVVAVVAVAVVSLIALAAWRMTASQAPTYADAAAMADKLGCSQSFRASDWATGPSEPSIGTCTRSGHVLTLATFPSSDAAHAWWMAAMQFGPHGKNDVTTMHGMSGANWAVASLDHVDDGVSDILNST